MESQLLLPAYCLSSMRQCTKCGELKPATHQYFVHCKTGKLGLHAQCKNCINHRRREKFKTRPLEERQYRNAYKREYARSHPDTIKKATKRRKDRYHSDMDFRDRTLKAGASYRAKEGIKEKIKLRTKKRYNNNREFYANKGRQRRARRKGAEGFHTAEDIQTLINNSKGLCWWCGEKIKGTPHIDHRIPLAKGGSDWPNNLCLSCSKCNLSKNAKMPHEFNGRLL